MAKFFRHKMNFFIFQLENLRSHGLLDIPSIILFSLQRLKILIYINKIKNTQIDLIKLSDNI